MSLEAHAINRLRRDLKGFRKNGLRFFLRHLAEEHAGLEEMLDAGAPFTPDATRLRRQPAFNPRIEPYDVTIELWEIEDQSPLTAVKLADISSFANDVYDLSFVFTEVWVTDRYGLLHRKVYDVREHIDGGFFPPDAQPHEWYNDGEWKQS